MLRLLQNPIAKAPGWGIWLVSWLIAALFLLTAYAKAQDVVGFLMKASYYRPLGAEWRVPAALLLIQLELLLAVLFAFRLWTVRLAIPFGGLALIGFSALIVYGWVEFGIDDCACLGTLAESPPEFALVKNALMFLGMIWIAWKERRHVPAGRRQLSLSLLALTVLTVAAALLVRPQL